MGLSCSFRFLLWSMFMILCCFPFKSHTYTINNPTSKNSSHWAGNSQRKCLQWPPVPGWQDPTGKLHEGCGSNMLITDHCDHLLVKNTHLLRPQKQKKHPAEKNEWVFFFFFKVTFLVFFWSDVMWSFTDVFWDYMWKCSGPASTGDFRRAFSQEHGQIYWSLLTKIGRSWGN